MNNCIDCDKPKKCNVGERCNSCAKKGRNNSIFGKKCPEHSKCMMGKNNPMYGVHRFGKNNPNYKGKIFKCKFCNEEINYQSFYYRKQLCKSCSHKNIKVSEETKNKIRNSEYHKNLKGRNNGNWQGGKSFEEYGAEFDNALKEQIRFRDKYTCQICGCSQLENGRQLDIHHIDYDKKDLDFNNLISLCHSCHMKTNGNRNHWTEYFKMKCR